MGGNVATAEEITALTEKMHSERAALVALLSGMSDREAEVRPPDKDGEEGWSVKEQLAHLGEMEATYRAWVRRALTEDRPTLSEGIARNAGPTALERANEPTLAELTAELERQREQTLELIAGIAPGDYERTAISPIFGELTVMQWVRSYYRHDRMHQAQISGEESDFQPRFRNGEPDQRRRRGRV